MRGLILGEVGSDLLTPVLYLAAMGTLGLVVASRRLGRLLLRRAGRGLHTRTQRAP